MKSEYMRTLDLGGAIRRGKELKEDRERLARESAARPEREHSEKIAEQQAEIDHEAIDEQKNAPVASLAAQALGADPEPVDEIMTITLEFTAPKSKLLGLRQYMTDNGILFTRVKVTA